MLGLAVRSFRNLLRLAFAPVLFLLHRFARPSGPILHLRIGSHVVDFAPHRPRFAKWFDRALGRTRRTSSTYRLQRLATHIAGDARITSVLVELPRAAMGYATAENLRDVLVTLRKAGKEVVAYLPQGGALREYFIASAANRIALGSGATLSFTPVSTESQYLGELLNRLGVEMSVHRRAEYKTAMESFARTSMSDEQRKQLIAVLETVDARVRGGLGERLGDRTAAAFEGVLFSEKAALASQLVDAVVHEDELPTLFPKTAKDEWQRLAGAAAAFAWYEWKLFAPVRRASYIAVVPLTGLIREPQMGAEMHPTVAALRAARSDPRAKAILLYVDSPGGSAAESVRLHRAVVRANEKKPVIAYFANTAASGGYYAGVAARRIVCRETTITGSIGVILGRPSVARVLNALGVRTEVVQAGEGTRVFSVTLPESEGENAALEREVDAHYRSFVESVAAGRGRAFEEIEPLARGRVWDGKNALAVGLVDRVGSLVDALDEAQSASGVTRKLDARMIVARDVRPPDPPDSKGTKGLLDLSVQALRATLAGTSTEELSDAAVLLTSRVLYFAPLPKLQ